MEKKIIATFIVEMLGRPAEHVESSLNELMDKLSKEVGVKVIEKKVHSAKKVEESELFTCFAEIEAEFDQIINILNMAFVYMPSHLEIVSPEEIKIQNRDISELIIQTILKLHKYDELAKKMVVDNTILENKINELVNYIQSIQKVRIEENIKTEDIKKEEPPKEKKKKR
jgi:hypothetical protein